MPHDGEPVGDCVLLHVAVEDGELPLEMLTVMVEEGEGEDDPLDVDDGV